MLRLSPNPQTCTADEARQFTDGLIGWLYETNNPYERMNVMQALHEFNEERWTRSL